MGVVRRGAAAVASMVNPKTHEQMGQAPYIYIYIYSRWASCRPLVHAYTRERARARGIHVHNIVFRDCGCPVRRRAVGVQKIFMQ